MRYTTLIDISEIPAVYRNINARLLYVHMTLRAGYHDADRDILDVSIRRLSYDSGLSISATRNALKLLERHSLITRQGSLYKVTKWIPGDIITARPKTARQQKQIEAAAIRAQEREQRDQEFEVERLRRETLVAQGKTSFDLYLDMLRKKADAGDQEAAAKLSKIESERTNKAPKSGA